MQEALLSRACPKYFAEETKVISPSLASIIPATPVISVSGSPCMAPLTIPGKIFKFHLWLNVLIFLLMFVVSYVKKASL